jgi:hypothetical protein
MKVYNKAYRKTEKYKEYKKRRKSSGKDLVVQRAYRKTKKGKQIWREYHKTEKYKGYSKNYARELRLKAVAKLGGKCSNPECHTPGGETDWRCLQIDHINGGGTKELREIKSRAVYRRVIQGYPGYQLLCSNCNWIKRYEKHEYPGK